MAELVDALDSKSGYRKVVQVRFLFGALADIQHVTQEDSRVLADFRNAMYRVFASILQARYLFLW